MKYVTRQKLTYVEYFVRVSHNIPQLLYDAFILRSITIAYMSMILMYAIVIERNCMTMHDVVFSMNITCGDVVMQEVLRLAPPPTHPSDVRPPVM